VSTDTAYQQPMKKHTANQLITPISEWQVFKFLDTLKHTATGPDGLPAWFLRVGAPIFAAPLQQIINLSLLSSQVPLQWKAAFITPIPKVHNPLAPVDYRPISITSVLSRLTEKFVVKSYIYPSLQLPHPPLSFHDQFAFRPTGSTTAALIYLISKVTHLLKTNSYVRIIALDFSKAFDSIRQSAVLDNLAILQLPDYVYNWLVDFFNGHSHATRYCNETSSWANVNASVVQGSAVGPVSFITSASDLTAKHSENEMEKYADDVNLVIAESHSETCIQELRHIDEWAEAKNLRLNKSKCVELIVRVRGYPVSRLPPPLPGIARVTELKTLGVTLRDDLAMSSHITAVLAASEKSLYALRILKTHGLPARAVMNVFRSVVLPKLLYCSPAWGGFINAGDRDRIEGFLRRCRRFGYYGSQDPGWAELSVQADNTLFKRVLSDPCHVLSSLLPPRFESTYNLRPRRHDRIQVSGLSHLSDSNFIERMLRNKCCLVNK
jgi:hypothetical protein